MSKISYTQDAFNRLGSDLWMDGVPWVIPGWLAEGEVHILAGAAKTGKSQLAIDLAAKITTGETWFDGTKLPVGRVGYYSNEEDAFKILIPRFEAAGGDGDHIHVGITNIDAAKNLDSITKSLLDPQFQDLPPLQLVVIDGVASAVDNVNDNSEVREYLYKTQEFARRTKSAVLLITHTAKGGESKYVKPQDFVLGAQAWVAVPRMTWVMVKDKRQSKKAALLVRLGNLPHPMDGGLVIFGGEFVSLGEGRNKLEVSTSKITASEIVEGDPDEIFAEALGLEVKKPHKADDAEMVQTAILMIVEDYAEKNNKAFISQTEVFDRIKASRDKAKDAVRILLKSNKLVRQCGIYGSANAKVWLGVPDANIPLGHGLGEADWGDDAA